jgi:hypothetical protein
MEAAKRLMHFNGRVTPTGGPLEYPLRGKSVSRCQAMRLRSSVFTRLAGTAVRIAPARRSLRPFSAVSTSVGARIFAHSRAHS